MIMTAVSEGKSTPIFHYDPKDFRFNISANDNTESKFDAILREKWETAEKDDVFRYKLNVKQWKILEGKYEFLAQLNLDRATNRRTPEKISSTNQAFDANRFNFTKLRAHEIYFDIEKGDGNNIIAVNVSPIEWGHCLFIPERFHQLSQKMTEHSLIKAVELLLISSSPNLRIVFNGLCAYASINHLHWHLYFLKHRMLVEKVKLNHVIGPVYTLEDFPSKGFCILLSSIPDKNITKFTHVTYLIVKYLQDHEIAHNVCITRAKAIPDAYNFDDVRIYIWARKPSFGVKDISSFLPAVCELFGHLIIRSEEAYRNLNEESIAEVLNDVTSSTFLSVRDNVRNVLSEYFLKEKEII